jgi:pectinesterase
MVIFLRCSLQDIIDPAGWESWKAGVSVPDTIYYGEFQNRGDGAKTQDRVKWPGFHDIPDPAVAENFTVLHIYEISVCTSSMMHLYLYPARTVTFNQ